MQPQDAIARIFFMRFLGICLLRIYIDYEDNYLIGVSVAKQRFNGMAGKFIALSLSLINITIYFGIQYGK